MLAYGKSLNSPFVRHCILPWWPQWPCASITRPDFLWFHAEHLRHLPLHRACCSLAHLDFWWISRSVLQHSSNLPCVSMTFCPSGRIYFASPVCSSPTAMPQPLPPSAPCFLLSRQWGQTVPSQWGGGRLFDASTGFFFRKTAVTWKQKDETLFRRLGMNRLSEGYKRAIDKIWGRIAKVGFWGGKPRPKKTPTSS